MMTFENVFSDAKKRLDHALRGNAPEQHHIQRCLTLAEMIEWNHSNLGNELGKMLGAKGVLLFDTIAPRVSSLLQDETTSELRNYQRFMHELMFVHDLGKIDPNTHAFDGSNHEARSADIIAENQDALQNELHWTEDNIEFLVYLTRHHGLFGITRIGEASIVFLSPILESLINLNTNRKQLFLDFLTLLTCCDAGASGDFATNTFYLDESRITLYDQLSRELFAISENLKQKDHAEASSALLAKASEFSNTVVRIKRIITSDNQLSAPDERIEKALNKMLSSGRFDAKSFALTRFDHGAYVFPQLLTHMERENKIVSEESLEKLLLFLGILCDGQHTQRIIPFRGSYSMKADLQARNANNFYALREAVEQGDPQKISDVLGKHINDFPGSV